MKIVDRHILSIALARWLVVLVIGVVLLGLVEFIGKMGFYVRALASAELRSVVAWYYLLRLPEFLLTWMPLSVAIAGMLVALPMLRQGTIMLLASAGVAPARVFLSLIGLGIFASALSYTLKDQVLPRLDPMIEAYDEQISARTNKARQKDRPAGWRVGAAFWCAQDSFPIQGRYRNVAVFVTSTPNAPTVFIAARSLEWTNGGWRLYDVDRAQGDDLRRLPVATPAELGIDPPLGRRQLAVSLQADSAKTGGELLRLGGPEGRRIVLDRVLSACLPLLALLFALPRFVLWENRLRLGASTVRTVLIALIPVVLVAAAGRFLAVSAANPYLVAIATAATLSGIGAWRWLRMRV